MNNYIKVIIKKWNWHMFWRNYYQMLFKGCLDTKLKQELIRKIKYHETKLSA